MTHSLPPDYLWEGEKLRQHVDVDSIRPQKIDFEKVDALFGKIAHIFERDESTRDPAKEQASPS
ncbi:MAG: hypothetical protein ABIO72_06110 [Patescibacteria group bacterium]